MYIVNGSHNTIAIAFSTNPNHYYPTWAGSRIYNIPNITGFTTAFFAKLWHYDSQDHGAVLNVGTEESITT
jgi:hypothetical protein